MLTPSAVNMDDRMLIGVAYNINVNMSTVTVAIKKMLTLAFQHANITIL